MELRHHHPLLALRGRRAPGRSGAPLGKRLGACMRRFSLDRALAEGRDPSSDPLLACRAQQLASPVSRRRTATAVRRLVATAERPAGLSAAAPIAPAVRSQRSRLLEIADRLTDDREVGIRGLATIHLMLSDACSPLWATGHAHEGELEDALETVTIGLGV